MSTNKNLTKKLILSITAIMMFILANIGLVKFNNKVEVSAANETSNLSVTNAEFANNKNQSYPYTTPSGYTAYAFGEELPSGQKNENCGVIDLTNEDYKTRFEDAINLNTDNYCLMLTSSDANSDFGYRTNDSLSLNANSNYIFSVSAYTETTAKIGSLALYNEDGSTYSELTNISSNRSWSKFYLLVRTGDESVKVKLGLNISGKGTILFDTISAMQVSNNYLVNTLNTLKSIPDSYNYTDELDQGAIEHVYTIENKNFVQNKLQDNKLVKTSEEFEIIRTALSSSDTQMTAESSGNFNSSVLLNHETANYSAFTTDDEFLTIKQNIVYKVSVTAKTENLSGKAYLKLIQTNLKDSEEGTNAEIEISSNSSSSVNNDYSNYNFYIIGSPKNDVTYKFSFALGSSDADATGKLSIAGITKTKINYSAYNDANSDAKKINLSEKSVYSDSKIYLDNATFDGMQIADYSKPYPATPEDWKVSAGKSNQYYGVVNTSSSEFAKLTSVVSVVNPFNSETNQNVLFMYNDSEEDLSYTSNTKSLDANKYYRFSINVQSQNAPVKVSLVSTKDDKEFELVSKSVSTGVQTWETVELYVKTGFENINVSLKLTIEGDVESAYAYADNAEFNYPTPTKAEYDSAINKVDLTNLLANSDLFTQPEDSDIVTSFIDMEDETNISKYVVNTQSFKTLNTNNVMLIKAYNNKFYTVKSNTGISLVADKIYKISVSVYTQNINSNDEEADLEKLGATIKLSSFDETFTSVVSNDVWTTYTFYVQPNSNTTTYLEVSIGSEDVNAKGDVFFGNIQVLSNDTDKFAVENQDENLANEFEIVSEKSNVKVVKNVKAEEEEDNSSSDENTETNEKEKTKLDKQTILFLIPSIIFAIAIVLAVVCTLVRKIKWKKPRKKAKKSDYDRTRTINKQVYARRAAVLRETKVRELKKKIEDLTNERNRYEEEYKATLSKIRELKIKRADKVEITKLEKDLKKNQKASASVGVVINKTTRELEYAKTEPYLQALIRRLHQEKLENYNPDEEK